MSGLLCLIWTCFKYTIFLIRELESVFIEEELKQLTKEIGSQKLLDKILKAYLKEMKEECFDDIEKEYRESKCDLEKLLTDEQKQAEKEMEELFVENMRYSIGFGFRQGLYAGFEQYFLVECTKDSFDKYVHQELLQMPNMRKYTEYFERKTKINKLFEEIQCCLKEDGTEQLTAVYSSYEEKELGVLRYSFYMGYRYSLNIAGEIDLFGVAKIADRVLYTEYELGFTMTGKEREQRMKRRIQVVE